MSDQFVGATSKVKQIHGDKSAEKDIIKGSYQNAKNRSNNSGVLGPFVFNILSASIIALMGTIVTLNLFKY